MPQGINWQGSRDKRILDPNIGVKRGCSELASSTLLAQISVWLLISRGMDVRSRKANIQLTAPAAHLAWASLMTERPSSPTARNRCWPSTWVAICRAPLVRRHAGMQGPITL